MTEETPERPPVRPAVYDVLERADGPVPDDELREAVREETSAGDLHLGATIKRMERTGAIYNANGDENDPAWKLTRP